MRIIAGSLQGRIISSPKVSSTHPMAEKIRGSLFATLGDISNLDLIDAYSGSGALALEAASRGASKIVAIESNRIASSVIRNNIVQLGLENQITLVCAKLSQWMATSNSIFDVILVDPPYLKPNLDEINNLQNLLKPNGIFVLSWPGKQALPSINLQLIKNKKFGDAQLCFFAK